MATTTAQEPRLQEVPPAEKEPKRKGPAPGTGGRPPGIVMKPTPPADTGSFWQWIGSIPKDDWQNLICYVWRTGPLVDLSGNGKPITIEKICQPFDSDYMLKTHGSGSYRFDVCHIKPDGTEQKRIRQAFETLMDLKYPPRVALGDWIDDPRNKNWEWAKPELEAAQQQRVQANVPQAQNKTAELKELLSLVGEITPKDNSTALLIELLRQQDPTKMLGLAKEIAALNQTAAANGDGSMQMMFMKFLLEEMKEARQLRAQPQENPLKVATELLTGAKSLFENMGVGGPSVPVKLDTGAVIVQQAGDVIGKIVDGLGQHVPSLIALFHHIKDRDLQIAQIAAARNMNPQRPFEYAGPTATPAVAQSQPSAPAPAAPSEPQQMTVPVFFTKYQALLQRNLPFLTDHFSNEDGYVFQDHIIDREGRNQFNEIRKDASVDLLMQLVQGHPQLREMFHPPEKARQFFEEFLSDPDQEPVPADGAAGAENASPEAN